MGWIWRPVNVFDVGIDGEIEIRDPMTGEATNCIVRVQAKATERAFASESESGLEFPCDANDLDYWLRGNVPVVLIVCRPSVNEAYWVSIRDYFRDPSVRKSGRVRFDKKANRFDATCAATLRQLALPRDSGIFGEEALERTVFEEIMIHPLMRTCFNDRDGGKWRIVRTLARGPRFFFLFKSFILILLILLK